LGELLSFGQRWLASTGGVELNSDFFHDRRARRPADRVASARAAFDWCQVAALAPVGFIVLPVRNRSSAAAACSY
jgi:hypothetical protein